ncbi:hypothetical protein CSC17_5285 [Klebsiella oxytoca]|nr:hypothetical protein CSC17_5285 [Klebsiella oxytoca]
MAMLVTLSILTWLQKFNTQHIAGHDKEETGWLTRFMYRLR